MANTHSRFLDSDVISNLLIMKVRSDINVNLIDPPEKFHLMTTQVIIREVQAIVNKTEQTKEMNGNALSDADVSKIKRTWKDIRKILTIKEIKDDRPLSLKNMGERSLVNAVIQYRMDCKIVSNNKADVIKYLKEKSLPEDIYQFPFEFFEEMEKFWFDNYKDVICFIILSNHDFRISSKKNLGNILTKIRTR